MNKAILTFALFCMTICGCFAQSPVTLKNDTLVNGSNAAIQLGFVDGEIGAANFLTPPTMYPMQITKVQFYWKSYFGSPAVLQNAIRIYKGGLPSPIEFFSVDGPQLTDGYLNEFDLTDYNVVLTTASSSITVGLEFGSNAPNGDPYKASLVTDTNGCTQYRNPIYANPGGWQDLYSYGASGNFVIRAIVQKVKVISGSITLQDYVGDKTVPKITMEIKDHLTGNVLLTKQVNLDANGHYTLPTTASGTVDVTAKAQFSLRKKVSNVTIGPTTTTVNFSLINGDSNNDNIVEDQDLLAVINNFLQPNPGYADLNGDGNVDDVDLLIVINHFLFQGD